MATYEVTAPNGVTFDVDAPDGASQQQVMAFAQSQYPKAIAERYAAIHHQLSALPPEQRSQVALSPSDQAVLHAHLQQTFQQANTPEARQQRFQQIQAQNVADMGTLGRFWTGVGEGAHGVVQGVKQNTYDRAADFIDGGNRVAQDEANIAEQRRQSQALNDTTAGKLGNLAGGVAETAPLALIPGAGAAGFGARLAAGVGTGLLAGYLAPSASGSEHNLNTLAGGVAGGAAPALASGLRTAVAGAATPEARELIRAGVRLTPGQTIGGALRRVEDGLTSVPAVGDMIRGAQLRSIQSFNNAAMNEALAPLGVTIPKGVAAGRDAINFGVDATEAAYDKALNGTTTLADQQMMTSLAQRINALPERVRQKTLDVLESQVFPAINESGGKLNGQQFKDMTSGVLGDLRAMGRSTDATDRNASKALGGVLDDLKGAFARSNGPERAANLTNADRAYRGFLKLQDAAAHDSQGANGVFTPAQFRAAVKRGDASKGKSAFARGKAHMQGLAETATNVLPRTVPDSGTAYRMFVGAGSLGGVGSLANLAGFGSVAHATLPAALVMGASALPYTRLGGRIAQGVLAPEVGPARSALAGLLGSYGSRAGLPLLIGVDSSRRNLLAPPPSPAALAAPATFGGN